MHKYKRMQSIYCINNKVSLNFIIASFGAFFSSFLPKNRFIYLYLNLNLEIMVKSFSINLIQKMEETKTLFKLKFS